MSQAPIPLQSISIASPCNASWDNMEGDDRSRFCPTCHRNVYNLSEMSRNEAEALIREKEGKLCVRFYRRADGTLLTSNCPVGLRVVQRPFKWLAAGAALLLASGVALATGHDPIKKCLPAGTPPLSADWRDIKPVKMVIEWFIPRPAEMGGIRMPPPGSSGPVSPPAPPAVAPVGAALPAPEESQAVKDG